MADTAFTRYELRRSGAGGELDYLAAIDTLRELRVPGWQEDEDGRELVFWVPEGASEPEGASPESSSEPERASEPVVAALAHLATLGTLTSTPEEADWEVRWRRFHQPVTVGELYIRPPWRPSRPGTLDLVIDVGMVFGTGGHATTRQCLEALAELPRGSLLDVGTGSGVLALAALRLGHGPVYALDVDERAVVEAEHNAERNGLEPTFIVGDVCDPALPLPDTNAVVANLDLGGILGLGERTAAEAAAVTEAGAVAEVGAAAEAGEGWAVRPWRPQHVLLAGLLHDQADEAVAAFPAFREAERRHLDEWTLVHLMPR